MKVGSLCSGIGALDKGLEQAGWDIAWHVENNPFCQQILKKHWPGIELISCVEDFLASQCPSPAVSVANPTSAGCGHSLFGSLAYYDHDTSSLKTSQPSLGEDWGACLVTLPRAGTMRNGIVYQQDSCTAMSGNGSSLWPTPLARDWKEGFSPKPHGRHSDSLPVRIGGFPHPEFYEELMGLPTGWSELPQPATPLLSMSRNGSAGKS